MTAIRMHGVTLHRGHRQVLHNVTFDIMPGTFTVVMGRNGAGKSTLLSAMAGLVSLHAGTVEVDGKGLLSWSRRELAVRVASLGQAELPDQELTALEVVLLGRAPHLGAWGLPAASDVETALHALETLEAKQLASRTLGTLSGGEKQRVLLARVVCQGSPVWLLDEPTDALDPAHALQVMRTLRARAEGGTTVVAVLHDLTLAARFAHRVVILAEGRVAMHGPVKDTLTAPVLSRAFGLPLTVVEVGGYPVVLPA
jgi:iron complex transport system ATP-binding protein